MTQKPPIGITPRWKVEEDRVWEIAAAIERYKDAGLDIPVEWTLEYKELHNKIAERSRKVGK
jgi:hypothetical protein